MSEQQKGASADTHTPEAGAAPRDQETKEKATATRPRSAGVENKAADDKVEVEFIHHHQAPNGEDGELVDYVPGETYSLPAGQARALVAANHAKFTDQ